MTVCVPAQTQSSRLHLAARASQVYLPKRPGHISVPSATQLDVTERESGSEKIVFACRSACRRPSLEPEYRVRRGVGGGNLALQEQ